jgi:hypothetical protein
MAVHDVVDEQTTCAMESPATMELFKKWTPPSPVVSKVASTGTELGSTLFAANPAQNCVDGHESEEIVPTPAGSGSMAKECPPSLVVTRTGCAL